MLIKIGTSWINPRHVAAVEPRYYPLHEAIEPERKSRIGERVEIYLAGCPQSSSIHLPCDSFEEAIALADRIASQVNSALESQE